MCKFEPTAIFSPGSEIVTSWRREEGRENASKTTLAVLEAIDRALSGNDRQHFKVLSIQIDELNSSCEVELELAPCVVMLVRDGADPDDEEGDWDFDAGILDVDHVANLVSFWVNHELDIRLDDLADRVVTTQRRLQIMSERWSAQGIPVEFQDIRIIHSRVLWLHQDIPVIVRYRTLNYHLEMQSFELEGDSLNDILDKYGTEEISAKRARAKRTLDALGAHGWIDKLAANAIRLNHDLAEFVRSGRLHSSYHYDAKPMLWAFDGHVSAIGQDERAKEVWWDKNLMQITKRSLPEAFLLSLPGRPITDVVEHPALTPDLIISRAWVENAYGVPTLMIMFDQPRLLFCKETGRVWEDVD